MKVVVDMINKEQARRIATEFAEKNNWPWSDKIVVKNALIPIIGGYRVVAHVAEESARVEIRISAFGKPTGGQVRYRQDYGTGDA